MAEGTVDSISYYDQHAECFAADTDNVDMSALYSRFLQYLPSGGRILDAGCGAGRDALAFAEQGYRVIAFDASTEMVRHSRERVAGRADVRQMRFDEVAWQGEFDGIWSSASLLHIPAPKFVAIAHRLLAALRPGGIWYMSFKLGQGERVSNDRLFVDHNEQSLRRVLTVANVKVVDLWQSADVRPDRTSERWLNALVTPGTSASTQGQR